MLSIKWNNEKMNLGISLIDEQHKKLVELINKIVVSIENNTQVENVEKLIEELIEYTKYHFSTEEKLFIEHNLEIKDIEKHKNEHKNFIDKSMGIYSNIKEDNSFKNNQGIEVLTDLYDYLTRWLVNHILIEDRKIFNK